MCIWMDSLQISSDSFREDFRSNKPVVAVLPQRVSLGRRILGAFCWVQI